MPHPPFPQHPWGALPPTGPGRFWLRVSRFLPGRWPWNRFALLARRLARRHLTGPVDVRVWGLALRLFPDRSVSESRILFLPRSWDRAERRWLGGRLSPGFTFVDVGANVGGYAFWVLSRTGPRSRIVAVEPNPELARQLRFNIAANAAHDRMTVVAAAVSERSGTGRLSITEPNSGENRLVQDPATASASVSSPGSSSARTSKPSSNPASDPESSPPTGPAAEATVKVPVLPLAEVVAVAGLERIDCLKVDVEGHEERVIRPFIESAPPALWPRLLVVEMKKPNPPGRVPAHRDPAAELAAWLVRRGYRLERRTKLNGLFRLDAA